MTEHVKPKIDNAIITPQHLSRDGLSRIFSSFGARIILLIVGSALPVAIIAGIISWNYYNQNIQISLNNTYKNSEETVKNIHDSIIKLQKISDFYTEDTTKISKIIDYYNFLNHIEGNKYCSIIIDSEEISIINKTLCSNENEYYSKNDFGIKIIKLNMNVFLLYKKNSPKRSSISKVDISNILYKNTNDEYYIISGENYKDIYKNHLSDEINKYYNSIIINDLSKNRKSDSFKYGYKTFFLSKTTEKYWTLIIHKEEKHYITYSNVFFVNIGIIITIISIELMVGFVFARDFLIIPLETLSKSVSAWQKGDIFTLDNNKHIPREIRQLERSFLRATRHLSHREKELKKSTHQQERLIHEIHHRVKNNLQIIASLLNLHANRVKSSEAQEEFRLVRDRVRAISTLHHHLYEKQEINHLQANIFIPEISNNLIASHKERTKERIKIHFDIDDILIPSSQASPVTLIITEAISNSLRYAFPGKDNGEIYIALKRENRTSIDQLVTLTLKDNGVGRSSEQLSTHRPDGIGRQLIRGFARQLHAEFTVEQEEGTTYRLTFILAPIEPTPSTMAFRSL